MADDAVWYELAYIAGITNGLNGLADGLMLPPDFVESGRRAVLPLVSPADASPRVNQIFGEITAFYATDRPPAVFRWMARDPRFLEGYWTATREAFTERRLDRLTKEILALAASLTARSEYGVDFHLREARRLGLSEDGLTEVVEVVQCFNTVTKIADALQLEPDFSRRPGPAAGAAR